MYRKTSKRKKYRNKKCNCNHSLKYSMSVTELIIIALVVIILCVILYVAYHLLKKSKRERKFYKEEPEPEQDQLYKQYEQIPDGYVTPQVIDTINTYAQIPNPNANDRLRAANLFHHNLGDTLQALGLYNLAVDDIANGNVNEAIDPADFLLQRIMDEVYFIGDNVVIDNFDDIINNIGNAHNTVAMTRKEDVERDGFIGKEATEEYLKRNTIFKSDSQNVHSALVNDDIKKVYDKISNKLPRTELEYIQIRNEIEKKIYDTYGPNGENPDPTKLRNANIALDTFAQNNEISHLNDKELNILANVWNRTKHPGNVRNQDNLQEAVVLQLADCVENGTGTVCITGRTDKVISALSHLDFDKDMEVKNEQWYKAEIFGKTKKLIDRETKRLSESDDPLSQQAKNYIEGKGDMDKIEDHLKEHVSKELKGEYTGEIRKDKLDILVNEALAGI